MTAPLDAPTAPAAAVASARETVAALADTLWAAARPEDLLAVTEEIQALRSTLAAVEARVAFEVEATEAAKTAGWVSPADYLTHVAGGLGRLGGLHLDRDPGLDRGEGGAEGLDLFGDGEQVLRPGGRPEGVGDCGDGLAGGRDRRSGVGRCIYECRHGGSQPGTTDSF